MATEWPFHLSDGLWSQMWRLLVAQDQPPRPYETEAEARALVLAILYGALTEVAWEDLPSVAPPAARVRAAYQHWADRGLLDRLSELLRIRLARL